MLGCGKHESKQQPAKQKPTPEQQQPAVSLLHYSVHSQPAKIEGIQNFIPLLNLLNDHGLIYSHVIGSFDL